MASLAVLDAGPQNADGHATGLLGLPAVLDRLSDPSHRCQGPELTCLLQALCKQLINAATDTNLVIFTSADRARVAAAQSAAADVAADLSIGAPERCLAPSLAAPGSAFGPTSSNIPLTHPGSAVPTSSLALPCSATSAHNSSPADSLVAAARVDAVAAATAAAACRRATGTTSAKAAAATTTAAPPPPPHSTSQPPSSTTSAGAAAAAAAAAASLAAGLSPAATTPTQGLAGMVAAGISLLVDHLEHFHYKAKSVALEGLLALSAVGLGPDRRLDPAGLSTLPLPGGSGGAPATSSAAAAAAAVAAAAALGGAGLEPGAVETAVQALGGLGLGDWLALRIVGAGAVPRLLELLTQRMGINFVPVRQVASQVVHNLARRRNAAVRASLARWRPLPGLISGLDVVLEDSPEIAARLLLVLSDLFPITSHQIAGVMHNLIAKHQPPPAPQPKPQEQPQQQQQSQQLDPQAKPPQQEQQQGQQEQHQLQQEGQQQPDKQPEIVGQQEGPAAAARGEAQEQQAAGPALETQPSGLQPQPPPAPAKGRKAKPATAAAVAPSVAASRPRRGAAAAAVAGPSAAAAGKDVTAAVAAAPAPAPALVPAAALVAAVPLPAAAALPLAPVVAAAAAATTAATTAAPPRHLGLAPDVDVPLEQLLLRVTGYYMRLPYNAVLAPAPLPQPPVAKAPYGDAERRDYERLLLAQKVEEHRRRRKEAGQLDCALAALLATAPLPSCLFEAMNYSYGRALAALTGPAPAAGLTATVAGGLWRAQDLLPYGLSLLTSLGGGADSGDGGGSSAAGANAAASRGGGGGSFLGMLMPAPVAAAAAPGGARGSLYGTTTAAVAAALDRFWGLEHPRDSSGLGGGGTSSLSLAASASAAMYSLDSASAASAAVMGGCPGPAVPGAPYGDRPVSDGLMQQAGGLIRAVLERATLAADALPAAVAATVNATAAHSAAGAGGGGGPVMRQAAAAAAETPPLAVLRAVGATLLGITRPQAAERVAGMEGPLQRLAAALAQHTGSGAAGVAQAKLALGLANVWACVHAAAAAARRRRQQEQRQRHLEMQQQLAAVAAATTAVIGAKSQRLGGSSGVGGGSSPGVGGRRAAAGAAVTNAALAGRGEATATSAAAAAVNLRRSSRIKRRRDGGTSATAAAAEQPAPAAAEAPTVDLAAAAAAAAANPPDASAADAVPAAATATAALPVAVAAPPTPGSPTDPAAAARRDSLLGYLVDLLAARLAEARSMAEGLDQQVRAGSAQVAAEAEAAALASAAAAATGQWLAAAAGGVCGGAADRPRQVLEAQALLLQAVALLQPGLEPSHARRLVDAGAVHCCARVLRAAAATSPASSLASSSASAFGPPGALAAALLPGSLAASAGDVVGMGVPNVGSAAAAEATEVETAGGPWNEAPVQGVTAPQALGLMVTLLQLSSGGGSPGGGGCGSGGVQQPEVLAALGGAALMLAAPAAPRHAAAAAAATTAGSAGAAMEEMGGRVSCVRTVSDEPTSRCWELLALMAVGQRPCAAHDALISLLSPLAALTHGSAPRCVAARGALLPVLAAIARWGHSRTPRQRLLVQALALWGPQLQPLLLTLPRMASPPPAAPEAVLVAAGATEAPPPVQLLAAAKNDGLAKAGGGAIANGGGGPTTSQSTMPYAPNRGGGRFGTPSTVGPAAPGSASGAATVMGTQAGQRTPLWSGRGNGAAAGPPFLMSPTRHAVPALRPAAAAGSAAGPAVTALNPARGRRGSSRLAHMAMASPPPRGSAATAGALLLGAAGAAAAFTRAAAAAAATAEAVTPGSLCELLETVLERLGDVEVLRHLHTTGWLRALCAGAHCSEPALRESCQRSLGHAARALAAAAAAAASTDVGPRPALPPLLLAELEVEGSGLRRLLCAVEPAVAPLLHQLAQHGGCGVAGDLPPLPLAPPQSLRLQLLGGGGGVSIAEAGMWMQGTPAAAAGAVAEEGAGREGHAEGEEEEEEERPRRSGRRRAATATGRGRKPVAASAAAKRGGAATRKGGAAPACAVAVKQEPEEEGGSLGGSGETAAAAMVAAGRSGRPAADVAALLVSPYAKRRRLSGEDDSGEEPCDGDACRTWAAGGDASAGVAAVKAEPVDDTAQRHLDVADRRGADAALGADVGPSGITAAVSGSPLGFGSAGAAVAAPPLELQLTAREARLAVAVRRACVSLEGALAARRHDLAAACAADQAAAAAAAAAATMAVAAAAAATAAIPAAPAAQPQRTTAPVGAKKSSKTSGGAVAAAAKVPAATARLQAAAGKATAAVPATAAVAATAAAPPPAAQPLAPLQQQQNHPAVADEEFLNRTYRGVSKRLNFDDV